MSLWQNSLVRDLIKLGMERFYNLLWKYRIVTMARSKTARQVEGHEIDSRFNIWTYVMWHSHAPPRYVPNLC